MSVASKHLWVISTKGSVHEHPTMLPDCFSSTLPSRPLLMRFARIYSSTLTGIVVKDIGRKSDSSDNSDVGRRRLSNGMTSADFQALGRILACFHQPCDIIANAPLAQGLVAKQYPNCVCAQKFGRD